MIYDDEFIKKMVSLGMLGYHVDKIANICDVPDEERKQFIRDFNNHDSEIRKAYQRGVDKADFEIDKKLFDMARNGDLKAMDKYEMRRAEHKTNL